MLNLSTPLKFMPARPRGRNVSFGTLASSALPFVHGFRF
jgi:hypothetical protein